MKWKGIVFLGLILTSFILGAYYPKVNFEEKESLILNAVINYLDVLHFKPQTVDDEFSNKAFDLYLNNIDPGKRFLVQSEIDQLSIYKDQIDDQIRLRNFDFFDASLEIMDAARLRAEEIFYEIIDSDFDLESDDFVEMNSEKRSFARDIEDLKMNWGKLVRFDVISRLEDKLNKQNEKHEELIEKDVLDDERPESINLNPDILEKSILPDYIKDEQEDSKDKDNVDKTASELKKEIIEEVKKSYGDWFKRISKERRSDKFETYVNTITHLFDPHSHYFNPKEKQDFDIRMGGKLEGIGARLQTEGDLTKVVSIVPGGPAWKGKKLEVDDLIVAVTQKGKEAVDIKGMRIDDVVQKIRGNKGTVVILSVKKKDGSMEDIEIERDEVIIDEGFARSLILDIPDAVEKIGYIRLPKFYSTFEGKDGNSCSLDVAKEIEKLKLENVNGIILDLRDNGGGSLQDVVDMSGLFIEEGPIVQAKPRNKDAYVYLDEDKTVNYDGPVVVMVNQFSASASEILAAALQDYSRAIIVGSSSTFGKATVQRFVDLDRAYRDNNEMKPLGQLKITMQKFYRVNGGSNQLKGVEPDIILPNNYQFIETGEKVYDFAMEWSEIEPVEYAQNVYIVDHIETIKERSTKRVRDNEAFQLIVENAKRLKRNKDQSKYPLDLDAYVAINEKRDSEAEKYNNLYEDNIDGLIVSNLDEDFEYINSDESRIARNDDWIKGVEKDFYLEEVLFVLKDMIEMDQKKLGLRE